jgi:hypothetical protein
MLIAGIVVGVAAIAGYIYRAKLLAVWAKVVALFKKK